MEMTFNYAGAWASVAVASTDPALLFSTNSGARVGVRVKNPASGILYVTLIKHGESAPTATTMVTNRACELELEEGQCADLNVREFSDVYAIFESAVSANVPCRELF